MILMTNKILFYLTQKYRKMRRRQEEGMADAPHTHTHSHSNNPHLEFVSRYLINNNN